MRRCDGQALQDTIDAIAVASVLSPVSRWCWTPWTGVARYEGWVSSVRVHRNAVYRAEFSDESIDTPRVDVSHGAVPSHLAVDPTGPLEAWEIRDRKVHWG